MDITIKDYTLIPTKHAPGKWDIVKGVVRKKNDSEETYDAEKVLGYGMSFQHALEFIIASELEKEEISVTLKQFIDAYKQERDEVLKLTEQLTFKTTMK